MVAQQKTKIPEDIYAMLNEAQRRVIADSPQGLVDQFAQEVRQQGFQQAFGKYKETFKKNYWPNGLPEKPKENKSPGIGKSLAIDAAGVLAAKGLDRLGDKAFDYVGGLFGGDDKTKTNTGSGGATGGSGGGIVDTAKGLGTATALKKGYDVVSGGLESLTTSASSEAINQGYQKGFESMMQQLGPSGAETLATTGVDAATQSLEGGMTSIDAPMSVDPSSLNNTTTPGQLSPIRQYMGPIALAMGAKGMYDVVTKAGQQNASASDAARASLKGGLAGAGIAAGLGGTIALGATLGIGSGALLGAQAGSIAGPIGTAIGAAVGALIGLGSAHFGSSKDERQVQRDMIRKSWRDIGVLDQDMNYGDFNVDQDGGKTIGRDGRKIYEIVKGHEDGTADMFAGEKGAIRGRIVGDLNPINIIIGGGENDAHGYGLGMMYNTLLEGGEKGTITKAQVHDIYRKSFANMEEAFSHLDRLAQEGKIDKNNLDAYKAGVHQVYIDMENGDTGAYGTDLDTQVERREPEIAEKIKAGEIPQGVFQSNIQNVMSTLQSNAQVQKPTSPTAGLASPPPMDEEEEKKRKEMLARYPMGGMPYGIR